MSSADNDTMARQISKTDAENRTYQYSYDPLSRISTIIDPLRYVADTRTYTNNGLVASRQDSNSNITNYLYDGFDRLAETTYPESSEEYSYDANNNVLTLITRIGATITNTYDVLNRLATRTPGTLETQTTTYDLAGRRLSISTPVSGSDPASGTYGYSYDTAGRLVQQTMPNTDTVGYQLDANGNRTQLIWPDGYYAEYQYDHMNRLTNILLNGSTSPSVTFDFDELSRRTQLTYANGCTCTYSYALNNDLSDQDFAFVGSSANFDYYYNRVHQITGLVPSDLSFFWTPSSSSTTEYAAANDLNQYPSVGGTSYSYDENGCTTGGPLTAVFDVLNRMTQAVSGSTTNNYWYDPINRQARKSVSGTDTDYLYNDQQLIATYDDSGDLMSRFIPGLGLDEHFINITSDSSTYLHTDRQGSIIAETDSSGVLENKFNYSPFGETSSISASNFGYTGQRYDSEIGLYNYKARYYSPAIGRFLQPDPIGYIAGDLNLYTYVGNNAINATDPLGLEPGLSSNRQLQSPTVTGSIAAIDSPLQFSTSPITPPFPFGQAFAPATTGPFVTPSSINGNVPIGYFGTSATGGPIVSGPLVTPQQIQIQQNPIFPPAPILQYPPPTSATFDQILQQIQQQNVQQLQQNLLNQVNQFTGNYDMTHAPTGMGPVAGTKGAGR